MPQHVNSVLHTTVLTYPLAVKQAKLPFLCFVICFVLFWVVFVLLNVQGFTGSRVTTNLMFSVEGHMPTIVHENSGVHI